MNTTTTSTTTTNNTSGNVNIGASAPIRSPPPKHTSSSSSSSNHHSHHHHHHSSSSQHKKDHSSQSQSQSSSQSQQNDIINNKISEFQCKLKFQNSLPEIPFEPKFLRIQSDFNRFTQYKTTSLERQYKHQLLTEPQLGIPIDLIDPSVYNTPKVPIKVPERDQPLLKPLSLQDLEEKSAAKKKSEIRPNVGWLRRTEYLSKAEENTFGRPVKRSSLPGENSPISNSINSSNNITNNNNKQLAIQPEQISDSTLIENTFDICASNYVFVHPTNPSLKPTSILPVFPDFELWPNSYTEVAFDTDPLDHYIPNNIRDDKVAEYSSRQDEIRNKAVVKGITDKFVYFITPDVKENNSNNNNDDEFTLDSETYKMQKVLTSDIVPDQSSSNYFFIIKDGTVYYNQLKNRVNLKKVKSKEEKYLIRTRIGKPKYITYKTREQNSKELQAKENILNDLLQEEKAPFSNKRLKYSKLSDDE